MRNLSGELIFGNFEASEDYFCWFFSPLGCFFLSDSGLWFRPVTDVEFAFAPKTPLVHT
ncbi:hypothetical protein [Ciceribacter thiooxidans]|uniref:Uncharacterized protein n=1 Tax=Ciceribacter thiooxidans TaxID=1969821 RepID=A0ABV7I033_9HYPH|nr:hypothetical protein [Ciceribacter thiooxidans]